MVSAETTGTTPGDDADEKSCFICLQTAAETPDAAWVTPCPCSLDAHEDCMLQWIAETEVTLKQGANRGKKLRCPACNARIRTVEPHDALVALGDRAVRAYQHTAPALLGTMLMGMGVVGSSFYGYHSMAAFAGEGETMAWLLSSFEDAAADVLAAAAAGGHQRPPGAPVVPVVPVAIGWRESMSFVNKVFLLNLVAPSLLLHRAVPSLANLIALPVSLVYGATLVSRHHLPRWPPSPRWAVVALPTLSIAYATAYYDLFGGLERRLNRALRGRPETDEAENRGHELRAPAAGNVAGNADGDDQRGVVARLRRLGALVAQLAGHDNDNGDNGEGPGPMGLEVAVDIVVEEVEEEPQGDDDDDDDGWVDDDDDNEILPPRVVRDDDLNILGDVGHVGGGNHNDNDDDDDVALPPPDILRARLGVAADADHGAGDLGAAHGANGDAIPLAEALAAQVADANGPVPAAEAPPPPAHAGGGGGGGGGAGGGMFVSDILAAITTQLLLPRFAATIGMLLGHVLPRKWVTPAAALQTTVRGGGRPGGGGLLTQRWGRSLVGGLLWIVLRDAWTLYIKYRRVQVKKQRKIKNVDRKRPKDAATQS